MTSLSVGTTPMIPIVNNESDSVQSVDSDSSLDIKVCDMSLKNSNIKSDTPSTTPPTVGTVLLVKKLDKTANLPYKQHGDDAGYDMSCICDVAIEPNGKCLVGTGIAFTVPKGTYGQIAPRSGLSNKGIFVNAGVIDRCYTGEVKIMLYNFSANTIELARGSRVAQLIVKKIDSPVVMEVDELNETERGEGGFGSTGSSA